MKFKKINKGGQVKIQQMIFMIIAVTLLFVLVGLFFLSISLSNLKRTATNLAEQNAANLVSKLSNSPEFSCENTFGTSMTNCIDSDKVIALEGDAFKYNNFWGVAKIEIREIYPDKGDTVCTPGNYPDCEIVNVLNRSVNSGPASSTFVSLCRKETDNKIIYGKCELAVLLVSSEVKG